MGGSRAGAGGTGLLAAAGASFLLDAGWIGLPVYSWAMELSVVVAWFK